MGVATSGSVASVPTIKALYCCFFLLGTGLMAPWAAILQTMDYMNAIFGAYSPSRILTVCYVSADLIALFSLFFFGDRLWPNKRSRLLSGYCVYTAVMVLLPILDAVLSKLSQPATPSALAGAYSVWAVCSAVVGAADACISTVAYGESAALGPVYTHAFIGGKAVSGLLLSALRCVSKAALPQTHAGLQRSTTIFLSFAAVIVLACVVVVAVALPRMRKQIEFLRSKPGLSIAQTLTALEAAQRLEALQRSASLRSPSMRPLQRTPTLARAMQAGANHFAHLGGGGAAARSTRVSLFAVIDAAISDAQARGEFGGWTAALAAAGVTRSPADVEAGERPECRRTREAPCAASDALSSAGELHGSGGSGGDAHAPEASQQHSATADVWRRAAGMALYAHRHQKTKAAQEAAGGGGAGGGGDEEQSGGSGGSRRGGDRCHSSSSSSSSSDSLPEPSTAGATYDDDTAMDEEEAEGAEDKLGPFAALQQPSAPAAQPEKRRAAAGWGRRSPPGAAEAPPRAALAPAKPPPPAAGAPWVVEGGKPAQLPRSQKSLHRFATDGGLVRQGLSVTTSSWLAIRLMHPYMTAVTVVFFTANLIFPMCLSPQVGEWHAVGSWYTLIMILSYEAGTLLGSTLPIVQPTYPRTTVVCLSMGMFAFVPAYVLALVLRAGPAAFIPLTFVMMTYGSYIAAMVFCLAPRGLLSRDCELVEVLLVLVLTVGYILGLFMSWLWKLPSLHAGAAAGSGH